MPAEVCAPVCYSGQINGQLLGFSSLNCKQTEMDDFIDRLLTAMSGLLQQKGCKYMFAKIDNLVPNTGEDSAADSYTGNGIYFIYRGEGAKAIAEEIFGTSLREGVCYTTEDLSRKQIVPLITDILNR